MNYNNFNNILTINEENNSNNNKNNNSNNNSNNLIDIIKQDTPRTEYSKLRNTREQATFNLMMRMDPNALSAIRQEFFKRNDSVSLIDFIYIMSKHLIDYTSEDKKIIRNIREDRDFVMDMSELFKEVDVNGDGMMEWEEFTKFTVEKASLLNQKFVISTLPEYVDSTPLLDNSMRQFRRQNIFNMLPMQSIGSFAVLEEHKKSVVVYHASDGHEVTSINMESVPLAIDWSSRHSVLFSSSSDLQIQLHQQISAKKYQLLSSWSTPNAQKSLAWMESNETLYSGSITGSIHCWKLGDKLSESSVVSGHSDICMKLLALDRLDNLMSASLDSTIGCWDTYTNTVIHKLRGHSKGVFDLSFNTDYRLLFSCGFDHDVFVWSPFVNSLVFKLKGHRSSLVGCQSVENSPEIITADEDGIFKLWDVRTFQCVQTFQRSNPIGSFEDPNDHLTCFFHTQRPTQQHNHKSRYFNYKKSNPSSLSSSLLGFGNGLGNNGIGGLGMINNNNINNLNNLTNININTTINTTTASTTTNVNNNTNPNINTNSSLNNNNNNNNNSNSNSNSNSSNPIDYRIYAGSRRIYSFDQKKIVQEKTTDYTNVMWIALNKTSHTILTVSNRNLIIWDLLLGSKLLVHNNICGEEISACCLDNRERKIIIGDVNGHINVYNPLNGTYMKSCPDDILSVVMSLVYLNDNRRFLAGYVNGTIRLYDESKLDDCFTIRTFDYFNSHRELLLMCYCPVDRSVITTGSIGQPLKFWDFDTGKCEFELDVCDEKETIVSIVVLEPYPLIATSDSDGNIIIWGSRGCKWKGDKITSFINITPYDAEMEPPSKGDHNGIPPQRILPSSYYEESLDGSQTNQSKADSHNNNNGHNNNFQNILNENSNNHSILGGDDEDQTISDLKACEKKWGKVSAATTISWDATNHILYTGDELGYLRKWSLLHVIDELGGMSMMHGSKHVKTKITTRKNARKGVNTAVLFNDINSLTSTLPLLLTKKTQIAFMHVLFCWCVQGHNETIIECVTTPHGIISSSTDNLVKMWTESGHLIGTLLHSIPIGLKSNSWNIPINIDIIRKNEEIELDGIISKLHELKNIHKTNEENQLNLTDSNDVNNSIIGNKNNNSDNVNNVNNGNNGGGSGSKVKQTKLGQSSLRKRIEMSGRNLGLNFNYDFDNENDDHNEIKTNKSNKINQHHGVGNNNNNNNSNKVRKRSGKDEFTKLEDIPLDGNYTNTNTLTLTTNSSNKISLPNLTNRKNINSKIKEKYSSILTFKKLEESLNTNDLVHKKPEIEIDFNHKNNNTNINNNNKDNSNNNNNTLNGSNKKTEILNRLKKKYNLNISLLHEPNHDILSHSNSLHQLQSPSHSMNFTRLDSDQYPSTLSDHSLDTPPNMKTSKTPHNLLSSPSSHFQF